MRIATSSSGASDLAKNPTREPCRCADLESRLERVEELARSNRRELDIQFRRIADLQAALDSPLLDRRRRKANGKANGKADGKGFGAQTAS